MCPEVMEVMESWGVGALGGSIGQRLVGLAVVFVLVPGLNGVHWPLACLCACVVGSNDDRQLIKFDSGYCGTSC